MAKQEEFDKLRKGIQSADRRRGLADVKKTEHEQQIESEKERFARENKEKE